MNQKEMKKIINEEFGFATNKIKLLEAGKTNGKYDYIMFEVCNIEYQMYYDYIIKAYKLTIWNSEIIKTK